MRRPEAVVYAINNTGGDFRDLSMFMDISKNYVSLAEVKPDAPVFVMSIDQAERLANCILFGLDILRGQPEPPTLSPDNPNLDVLAKHTPDLQPSEFRDDPHVGYLIRHEHKDLFYGPYDDTHRACTVVKEYARVFNTKYEAQSHLQAIKHPTTVITVDTTLIISFRVSQNDRPSYYVCGEPEGTPIRSKATRLTSEEAERIMRTFPSSLYITIEKLHI